MQIVLGRAIIDIKIDKRDFRRPVIMRRRINREISTRTTRYQGSDEPYPQITGYDVSKLRNASVRKP